MHSLTSALTSLLLLLFLAFLPHLSNSAPGYTRQDLSHLALLPPDPDLPKENIHPTDILIVTTVDGSLHAVHKPTGTVLWTKGDTWGPLVDVRDVAAEDRMNGNDEDGFGTTVPDVVARDGDGGNADVAPFVGGNLDGDEDMPRGLYIPEPTGNGDLYYYEPGKAIRKLPLPIKKIVDDNHPFMFGDYVFTGKKVNRLLAVSPLTGDVLRTFGGDGAEEGPARLPGPAETSYLYIGRTQYVLSMWDKKNTKLRLNITYGEFSAPTAPDLVLGDLATPPSETSGPAGRKDVSITAEADGWLTVHGQGTDYPLRLQFDSPAVAAFHIGQESSTTTPSFHLAKAYPSASPPTAPSLSALTKQDAYVGHHNGSFYIMSEKNFPNIAAASSSVVPSLPAAGADYCARANNPSEDMLARCLVGTHTLVEYETRGFVGWVRGLEMGGGRGWAWVAMRVGFAVAVLAACVAKWGRNYVRRVFSTAAGSSYTPVDVGGPSEAMVEVRQIKSGETSDDPDSAAERGASPPVTPTSKPKKKKPSKKVKLPTTPDTSDALSPTPTATSTSSLPSTLGHTSLSSLTVGDEVLGYGSHGTVVYKGTFQGRDVAVKRLLLDFYEVADHEVRMLQESDDHPNVVRYFYREKAKGFMYIALELCPASLADVIEKPNDALISALRMRLKPASVLFQIARGLHHLHELKIVHRDIKPQNILVGAHKDSKTGAHPRVLISDFGLGKRLGDDQSSFHHTHHTAGGTVGWRAPECILAQNSFPIPVDASNTTTTTSSFSSSSSSSDSTGNGGGVEPNPAVRITKSIDIFSLGCVFHYVLTAGSHPFGDKFAREINILKGNHRLDKIDTLPESAIEAKDLIRRMIAKDPLKRPTTSHVLIHPFFWPPTKRLNFLADASDRLEIEPRDPPSPLLKMLERGAHKVVGQDWYRRIDRALLDNLGKYRKYDGAVVRDLLRVVRNKKHHYQDLPPDVQHSLGTLPAGFVAYFTSRFPALLMHVYYVVADSRLRNEDMFRVYFQPPE